MDELDDLQEKLNLETAKIPWKELQKFFASGSVIEVEPSLDLIEVGEALAQDNTDTVASLIEQNRIGAVTDERALQWIEKDVSVWAVVIRPWILVQYLEKLPK